MSKYNKLKVLRITKARTEQICNWCGRVIYVGEEYYRESLKDKFLQSLHRKMFCNECYNKYGEKLMKMKKKRITTPKHIPGQTNLFK